MVKRIRCMILFFFKQKTAYEMRISDWSSDVCSSDLPNSRGGLMRKLITSVAAAAFLSIPAHAATVLLDSVTSVSDGYEFSYAGTLDDTEGLRNGSQLVIFDFAGYVDGSVFSPYDDVAASVDRKSTRLNSSQ